ncbi:hypothetical protein EJ08DRAFT_671193 [Tothia fuscella]|uniref:CENP-V/GFA domain-containing protein n=1 Tax=Tothia fuscella TaxID=1048955 RepID=A0A9P4TXP8_9PEZI|nr:hypothetical protein EJ08DRAFT_671193 [Tothia fuscella]
MGAHLAFLYLDSRSYKNLEKNKIESAISCTCTLCQKKGSLWLVPPANSFQIVRDNKHLTEYQSASLRDTFCSFCGTQIPGLHRTGPLAGQYVVNVRTIHDPYFNLFQTEQAATIADTEDTRTVELVTAPSSQIPAEHVLACHCGHLQAELLVPIRDQELKEDNCSSCVRIGYIGVYPTKDQVIIHGREHGFKYLIGRKYSGRVHCKTCGVHVFSNIYGQPMSIFDALPAERRENALKLYHQNMQTQPLNVRAMEGVDLTILEIERSDLGTAGYELED